MKLFNLIQVTVCDIVSVHQFCFECRTKTYLRKHGYYVGNIKAFSISIYTQFKTYIIEV